MPPRTRPLKARQTAFAKIERFLGTGVGLVAASLVIILSAPVFVSAVDNPAGGIDLNAIFASLEKVHAEINDLGVRFQTQQHQLDALTGQGTDPAVEAPGMGACLAECRTKGVACLKNPATTNTSTSTPVLPASIVGTNDAACRKVVEACVQACKPQPATTASCESRCAVGLGACIRAAGNDLNAVQKCGIADRICVAQLCLKPAGSVLLQAGRLPPNTCRSQCRLEALICRQSAKYDTDAAQECNSIERVCVEVVCHNQEVDVPIGQEITVVCENQCTGTFNACSSKAKDNPTAQNSCNNAYGVCRDNCRKLVGGTATTAPTTTVPPTGGTTAPPPSSAAVECNKACYKDYGACAISVSEGKTTSDACYATYLSCHGKCQKLSTTAPPPPPPPAPADATRNTVPQ